MKTPYLILMNEDLMPPKHYGEAHLSNTKIRITNDPEKHAKETDTKTAGEIEFKYVPVGTAYYAPELLEALKEITETFKGCLGGSDPLYYEDFKDEINKAEQAIKKAEL